jgi:putative ABC transport system permease protein
MSLLTVKLRRDVTATWPRLLMMVVAIAVSLTVFGGVLFAWSAISRETERAYLDTQPASATIRFSPLVDATGIAALTNLAQTQPGVLAATGRTQFTGKVRVNGQARDIPLQVFATAPDDPMRIATFAVEQGSWPPAPGDVLLRRDTLALLTAKVGDTVTVTTPSGSPLTLRVAGTVYDPSLAPAAQQQTGQAYLSTTTLASAGDPAVFDQLKFQVTEPGRTTASRDRDTITATAGAVAERMQAQGLSIREIQIPRPYAHLHQGQADALLSALLIGAGAALLLAAILVATMLNGLFTQQIPQIGIMKAIGGRSATIGRFYLLMTLLVATAATVVALPLATLIGRGMAPAVLGFLGIEPVSTTADGWTYPAVAAVGLAMPLLMTLIPLVKAARVTVRQAIDHRGVSVRTRLTGSLLAGLGRLPKLDRGLLLAARNTGRRPARFILSAGLLASAGMMFVAGMSARDSTQAVADEASTRLRWDVTVQLAQPTSMDTLTRGLASVAGVDRVEGWTVLSAAVSGPGRLPFTRTYPDQGHGGVFVTAIPDQTQLLSRPPLTEGRWLDPNETGAIVLSQVTLKNTGYAVHPGDTVDLTLDGQRTTWRVAGISEERGDGGGAYVTAEGLAAAIGRPAWPNTLRIVTSDHDETTRQAVADTAAAALISAGTQVRSADSVGRQETATGGHLAPILVILLATALPMGLIGCIGLAATMSANVLERTREFGVMHAIGARPRTVRRIVAAEGVFIAVASCLLAIPPALGLTAGMDALLGNLFFAAPLPYRISALSIVLWTALIVLGAVLATDAAAARASRLTVREALAHL